MRRRPRGAAARFYSQKAVYAAQKNESEIAAHFHDLGSKESANLSLVVILGFGVYLSSFLKDLVCAPRPYSPPVERLST